MKLNPTARSSYSLRRFYVDAFLQRQIGGMAGHGRTLLDLGGQKTNKRGFFDINRYAFRVTCLNISAAKGADLLGDAHTLPFADRSFDVALCSELLEHV
ncbi:MAG: methyltransferase domain-containing protein, partial [Anaerolineae bacterium]